MLHSVYLSARLSSPVTLVTFELTIFCYFTTPLLLLNYFLFNLFSFSQKSVGGATPPSARSLSVQAKNKNFTPSSIFEHKSCHLSRLHNHLPLLTMILSTGYQSASESPAAMLVRLGRNETGQHLPAE